MTERYDHITAVHYAAYRPPLHRAILERALHKQECFRTGIDIGCGSGHSTVALAAFCGQVFGVDSSRAMLQRAQAHPRITYVHGSGDDLEGLPGDAWDVVTFAGSLFYTKTTRLRQGLVRRCPRRATILVYDFDVLLADLVAELGLQVASVASAYDHRVNLADWTEFAEVLRGSERLTLDVSVQETAHLLLADSGRYDAVCQRFRGLSPFDALVDHLRQPAGARRLHADIIFTRYQVVGA